MLYEDRIHAAEILSEVLKNNNVEFDVVVPLMRGGIILGKVIAENFKKPLIPFFVRKIGFPSNEEFAVACVTKNVLVYNKSIEYTVKKDPNLKFYVEEQKDKKILEIKNLEEKLYSGLDEKTVSFIKNFNFENKKVLLVDDGLATGTSMLCAVKDFERKKSKVIVAVPISSRDAFELLESNNVRVLVPMIPEKFYAVGQFYYSFDQITIEECKETLKEFYSKFKVFIKE